MLSHGQYRLETPLRLRLGEFRARGHDVIAVAGKRFGHHEGVPGVGADLDTPVVEPFFVEQPIEPRADLAPGGM